MAIHDKTQLKAQNLQRKALYKKNAHYNKSNSNYYSSVASVDSSSIESTVYFPKHLTKCITAYVENTSKQNKFLISLNTK